MATRPRPTARGALFVVLAAGLLAIAWKALDAGRWEISLPAAVIGLWMADLALREMGIRRSR
jgi:uncharacterized membrane protein YjjP (DUF1212 family)